MVKKFRNPGYLILCIVSTARCNLWLKFRRFYKLENEKLSLKISVRFPFVLLLLINDFRYDHPKPYANLFIGKSWNRFTVRFSLPACKESFWYFFLHDWFIVYIVFYFNSFYYNGKFLYALRQFNVAFSAYCHSWITFVLYAFLAKTLFLYYILNNVFGSFKWSKFLIALTQT